VWLATLNELRSQDLKGVNPMTDESSERFTKNRCPHCGHVAEVPAHLIGETISCPNSACRQVFRIAVAQGEPADEEEASVRAGIAANETQTLDQGKLSDEAVLFVVHPALARQRPLRALLVALAGLLGLGALVVWLGQRWELLDGVFGQLPSWLVLSVGILLTTGAVSLYVWWWVLTLFTKLTVTNKRTTYREGIIARETSEVQHDDVRNLQIDQGVVERLLGIGHVAISSSGQDDMEIEVSGIPRPNRVAETIRKYQ
jgi:membrane protein YdbS with pleckstrin-like domain